MADERFFRFTLYFGVEVGWETHSLHCSSWSIDPTEFEAKTEMKDTPAVSINDDASTSEPSATATIAVLSAAAASRAASICFPLL
jgi:hypothetical protein